MPRGGNVLRPSLDEALPHLALPFALVRRQGVGFATRSSPGQATMYSRMDLRSTADQDLISDDILWR